MSTQPIRFHHRGQTVEVTGVATTRSVLDWLREDAGCVGTKEGCNEGDCGACTVVVAELDDTAGSTGLALKTVNACLQFLPTLDGRALFTVEDLKPMNGGSLHPVQQAMVDSHASQCGFCTPGFVMSLWLAYVQTEPGTVPPSRAQLADALSGNLCRCTGYRPILDAGERMFALPPVVFDAPGVATALRPLQRDTVFRYQGPSRHDVNPNALRTDVFSAPRTIDELAALRLAQPHATLLSGCTDIGLWVNKQLRDLGDIVYLGEVKALKTISQRDGVLHVGAGVSLEVAWAALASHAPELTEVWRRFASPPIRHAGTLGGNLANGSPIGDSAPVLLALDAVLVLQHGAAERRVPLHAFYLGYMENQLAEGEWLSAIELPLNAFDAQVRSYKISKRFDCDISAVCAGLSVKVDAQNIVTQVRLAFGGMAATVQRASTAEAALMGKAWTLGAVQHARLALAVDFQPLSDLRASAAYRLQVAQNLLQRFWLETRRVDPLPPRSTRVWPILPAEPKR